MFFTIIGEQLQILFKFCYCRPQSAKFVPLLYNLWHCTSNSIQKKVKILINTESLTEFIILTALDEFLRNQQAL